MSRCCCPPRNSAQRLAGRLEDARPPHDDSIQNQTREPVETSLYFPDYVDGGGWSVQLALGNIDAETAAEVVVEVYDQNGGPILDLFDSGSSFEIPPLGTRVSRSAGTGAIWRGWIQVRTRAAPVSGRLMYKQGTTGIEVSVEPVELGDRFALFVEESGDIGAGVAIFMKRGTRLSPPSPPVGDGVGGLGGGVQPGSRKEKRGGCFAMDSKNWHDFCCP